MPKLSARGSPRRQLGGEVPDRDDDADWARSQAEFTVVMPSQSAPYVARRQGQWSGVGFGSQSVPRGYVRLYLGDTVLNSAHARRSNHQYVDIGSLRLGHKTTIPLEGARSDCKASCAGHDGPARAATGCRRSPAGHSPAERPHLRGRQERCITTPTSPVPSWRCTGNHHSGSGWR